MHQELCQGNPGLCRKMKPIEGSQLLSYLKRVRFNGEYNVYSSNAYSNTNDSNDNIRSAQLKHSSSQSKMAFQLARSQLLESTSY